MNTTFLIGNGFDLRLGMNTRYSDVYKTYIDEPSASDSIKGFKEELKKDAPKGYPTWGDFEMAMGKHSEKYEDADEFVSCVRDFKTHMGNHLKKEEVTYLLSIESIPDYERIVIEEMRRSIRDYFLGQDNNTIAAIKRMRRQYPAQNDYFISFNYTKTLDYFLSMLGGKEPVHIHGSLDSDVVVGVDNIEQIANDNFRSLKKVQRSFVKPLFNQMYDLERVKAASEMINISHVVCVYGLSLGESDAVWRMVIYQWLKRDKDHHLVYYMYDEHIYNLWLRDEIMDKEEERKSELMIRLGVPAQEVDELYEQVHVPVGYDIFNFKRLLERYSKNTKAEYLTATSRPIRE